MATILIIEDEESIRLLLRSALEAAGYEVTEATNGRQGLELYRHRPTDLVITDILMPDQDGLETILELRRLAPEAKIIAISGGGQSGLLDLLPIAEKLGAQWTLRKPLRRLELLEAIRQLVPHQDGTL